MLHAQFILSASLLAMNSLLSSGRDHAHCSAPFFLHPGMGFRYRCQGQHSKRKQILICCCLCFGVPLAFSPVIFSDRWMESGVKNSAKVRAGDESCAWWRPRAPPPHCASCGYRLNIYLHFPRLIYETIYIGWNLFCTHYSFSLLYFCFGLCSYGFVCKRICLRI